MNDSEVTKLTQDILIFTTSQSLNAKKKPRLQLFLIWSTASHQKTHQLLTTSQLSKNFHQVSRWVVFEQVGNCVWGENSKLIRKGFKYEEQLAHCKRIAKEAVDIYLRILLCCPLKQRQYWFKNTSNQHIVSHCQQYLQISQYFFFDDSLFY